MLVNVELSYPPRYGYNKVWITKFQVVGVPGYSEEEIFGDTQKSQTLYNKLQNMIRMSERFHNEGKEPVGVVIRRISSIDLS